MNTIEIFLEENDPETFTKPRITTYAGVTSQVSYLEINPLEITSDIFDINEIGEESRQKFRAFTYLLGKCLPNNFHLHQFWEKTNRNLECCAGVKTESEFGSSSPGKSDNNSIVNEGNPSFTSTFRAPFDGKQDLQTFSKIPNT